MPKVKANGIIINYETRGHGKPILFIHGIGLSWRMWEPQVEAFSTKYKMIMIDLRGHGESSKEFPKGKYSMRILAEDVKHFLDAIEIKKISIIGISQGAIVASLFAAKYPEYVEKLVLSNGYSEIPTKLGRYLFHILTAILRLMSISTIVKLMMKVYGKEERTKKMILNSLTIDNSMLAVMTKLEFPNHTRELHRINSPTLIMAGGFKIIGPEIKAAKIMFKNIPESTVAIFEGTFDPLSTTRREVFNDMILNFLQGNKLKKYHRVTYIYK